jgi:hypothetical protein
MGVLGAVGSYVFGGSEGLATYFANQATGRGGFGTTMGDLFWQGMTGTPALDSALAGGRMNATMLNAMGVSPSLMAYSAFADPYGMQALPYPAMMMGANAWGLNYY